MFNFYLSLYAQRDRVHNLLNDYKDIDHRKIDVIIRAIFDSISSIYRDSYCNDENRQDCVEYRKKEARFIIEMVSDLVDYLERNTTINCTKLLRDDIGVRYDKDILYLSIPPIFCRDKVYEIKIEI